MSEISPLFAIEAEELLRRGNVEEAISLCLKGRAVYPEYPAAYTILANAYVQLGDFDAAKVELQEGKANFPRNKVIYELAGLVNELNPGDDIPERFKISDNSNIAKPTIQTAPEPVKEEPFDPNAVDWSQYSLDDEDETAQLQDMISNPQDIIDEPDTQTPELISSVPEPEPTVEEDNFDPNNMDLSQLLLGEDEPETTSETSQTVLEQELETTATSQVEQPIDTEEDFDPNSVDWSQFGLENDEEPDLNNLPKATVAEPQKSEIIETSNNDTEDSEIEIDFSVFDLPPGEGYDGDTESPEFLALKEQIAVLSKEFEKDNDDVKREESHDEVVEIDEEDANVNIDEADYFSQFDNSEEEQSLLATAEDYNNEEYVEEPTTIIEGPVEPGIPAPTVNSSEDDDDDLLDDSFLSSLSSALESGSEIISSDENISPNEELIEDKPVENSLNSDEEAELDDDFLSSFANALENVSENDIEVENNQENIEEANETKPISFKTPASTTIKNITSKKTGFIPRNVDPTDISIIPGLDELTVNMYEPKSGKNLGAKQGLDLIKLASGLGDAKISIPDEQPIPVEEEIVPTFTGAATETMARILTGQCKYDEAISIYKALIEKSPEKTEYYSAQIERLTGLKQEADLM